jgi:uronate dehydrogenase
VTKQRILITGAAGRIGTVLTRHLAGRYELRLMDIRIPETSTGDHPFITVDVADLEAMRAACQDVDLVLHLAANPSTAATWDSLLPNNVIGVYNLFQAATDAGCRRVIFASSVNAVSGYPAEIQVNTQMQVRPPNLYGATKAWGEAVAYAFAHQGGPSAICLRLGWVVARDNPAIQRNHRFLDMVLTYADLTRLFDACLAAPDDLRYGVFHGISDNRWKRLDISDTRSVLGYQPEDDGFALAGLVSGD